MVRFSGKARKTNHLFSHARAKRAREASFKFYVWFQQMVEVIFNSLLI
ncbi:MAG: hypothetical protein U5L45_26245 [Saprospiraceae bacterium]|nr:hypothetical protein [Saprospiraceae bacterium]